MKKTVITLAVAALAAVATSTGASAGNGAPTCSDIDVLLEKEWENHGTHVREDYVFNTEDGSAGGARGGPAHQPIGSKAAPGASFCLDQAQSPGLHFPPPPVEP